MDRLPAFIETEDVTFRGPLGPVFEHTTLAFRPGERWAAIGPSGGEKSLFFSALMGRLPLLGGQLRHPFLAGDPRFADSVFGVLPPGSLALASMEEHRQWLVARDFHQLRWHGSLSQGSATVSQLLQRNLVEQRNPFAVLDEQGDAAFAQARAREIARFELEPLLDRPIVALSNGELHRFVMARALLRRPRLLFIDDPMAGLDLHSRGRLLAILDQLDAEGIAVVVGVESEADVPPAATHLLALASARVAEAGPRRPSLAGVPNKTVRTFVIPPKTVHAPAAPVLQMREVRIRQGDLTLLDGITWTVQAGEHWALLGPNGSGKSTLLSLVLADNPQVYTNQVSVGGCPLQPGRSIWEQKAQVGWLSPELEAHYPSDTRALDVVLSGFASSLGVYTRVSVQDEHEAKTWLDHLGLAGREETPLWQLPSLDRRLLLLARAVVHRPLLLLFDEPCQGLDAGERLTLTSAISAAVSALGAAMIYVSHDPGEIPASVNHVLRLEHGHVAALGPRDRAG